MPGVEDWQERLLRTAQSPKLASRVIQAIESFLLEDGHLFVRATNEKAMTALLACHLRRVFPEWNVDCEFNRDVGSASDIKEHRGSKVLPDIIVHRRGTRNNLLVIEVKQSSRSGEQKGDRDDIAKLRNYLSLTRYRYALFLKFITREAAPGLWRAEWVIEAVPALAEAMPPLA